MDKKKLFIIFLIFTVLFCVVPVHAEENWARKANQDMKDLLRSTAQQNRDMMNSMNALKRGNDVETSSIFSSSNQKIDIPKIVPPPKILWWQKLIPWTAPSVKSNILDRATTIPYYTKYLTDNNVLKPLPLERNSKIISDINKPFINTINTIPMPDTLKINTLPLPKIDTKIEVPDAAKINTLPLPKIDTKIEVPDAAKPPSFTYFDSYNLAIKPMSFQEINYDQFGSYNLQYSSIDQPLKYDAFKQFSATNYNLNHIDSYSSDGIYQPLGYIPMTNAFNQYQIDNLYQVNNWNNININNPIYTAPRINSIPQAPRVSRIGGY